MYVGSLYPISNIVSINTAKTPTKTVKAVSHRSLIKRKLVAWMLKESKSSLLEIRLKQ